MMEEENLELPPLVWRRLSSDERRYWLVRDGAGVIAVVYEIGENDQSWLYYHLVGNTWVLLMESDILIPGSGGFQPHFAPILGYSPGLDLYSGYVVVVERGGGSMWWLFYSLSGNEVEFAIQAAVADMIHEFWVQDSD